MKDGEEEERRVTPQLAACNTHATTLPTRSRMSTRVRCPCRLSSRSQPHGMYSCTQYAGSGEIVSCEQGPVPVRYKPRDVMSFDPIIL